MILDGFFAALAAIGFAAISRPPARAYIWCALTAAVGHSLRYLCMHDTLLSMEIIPATFIAAVAVGLMAVLVSPLAKMPAETCLFPALLPMIPGVYAYKAFAGLGLCIMAKTPEAFDHSFFLFSQNGLTTLAVLAVMVVGATLPIFALGKISFTATR